MAKSIKVQVKTSYGNTLIYPVCDTAKLFAKLTGNKTLRMSDMEVIRKLGYSVEQVMPERIFG